MKKNIISIMILLCSLQAFAAGIMIKDAVAGEYLRLMDLSINLQIINQVAITNLSARFVNDS
ncbi:MAG TPA: hypothetical protein PL020_06850, partial [Candidatus Cloacimonadota bacterium]|nr:hypothetical protein [Candidatus Cloacimonadota bacterium]